MNILALNPGSASLKFDLVAGDPPSDSRIRLRKLLSGVIEPVQDYAQATTKILSQITDSGAAIDLWACRVVHGGSRYRDPARIDRTLLSAIEDLDDVAPLHNAKSVAVIRAALEKLGDVPGMAVFDTAFHRYLPDRASVYAIPWELTERYGIRRYGFHGISHQYLLTRYCELSGISGEEANIITLHLAGGSSAAAIVRGKSIDTSMGFTPLEGLAMSTRSGDLDAGIVAFLARKENAGMDQIEERLNKKSGLLGISGTSPDTRVLAKAAASDPRADLALDVFSYRVKKYIGAYLAAMGGASAVVFSGGIGENTPEVRRRICQGLEWFGLELDLARNESIVEGEAEISRQGSRVEVLVIPSEEGLMIAHEALRGAK